MATLTGISILGVLVYCFIFHRETLLEALSVIIYFSIVFALHCLFAPEIVSYSSKNGAWYESDDGGINFHKRG